MAKEHPLVRLFVACERLDIPPEGGVTLHNVIFRIKRLPGEPFPCIREQMGLFALLTNGRGQHDLGIGLFFLDQGMETTIREPIYRTIDFGQDPTIVFGLPVPNARALFEKPGQYTFALLCGNVRIADYHFEVQ